MLCAASQAGAQCPDGTPPPCAASRRAAPVKRAVPSPDARARRFMLLPFRNVTRVTAQDWLVTGAPLMLGESLGQFEDLTVVSEEKLNAARRRLSIRADSLPDATQLRRLAEETDGWTAITGNLYATGRTLRISLLATDVQTGAVKRAEAVIAVDADARQAFDSLTVKLVTPTGVRGAHADLAALTTQSADAYRAYVRGVEFMQRSAFRRAQAAFTEAVTLDSTFALAWERLAVSTADRSPLALFDPASPLARAFDQAARFATRLPSRRREYVRAFHAFMQGQFGRGRRTLDSLVTTDPDDLDTRETLAGLEIMSPDLDTAKGPPRMATSINHAMRLALEVLERDPGRRNVHLVFAIGYGFGAGWWDGVRTGMSGTFPSLAAAAISGMTKGWDAVFVPVVLDSIVDVPAAEFLNLPPAERARLRRRSAVAGAEWMDRWLSVGPQDAEAHAWASHFAELRGDATRALREFVIADSLGLETSMEIVPQRRLTLLVRAEQYAAAAALADSLLRRGALAQRGITGGLDLGRGYGMAAFLIQKRWADAGAAASARRPMNGIGPPCRVALPELATASGEAGGPALQAMTDTVARHLMAVAAVPTLAPCLGNLVLLVNDSTAGRRTFAGAALLAIADSLHRAGGSEAMAYRVAAWAWAADTAQHAAISGRSWFGARSRALAIGRHFVPGSAVVEGDSVVFAFRLNASAPVEPTETADSTEWSLRVEMSSGRTNDAVVLDLLMGSAASGDRPAGSGALARVAAMRMRKAEQWPANVLTDRTTATASVKATTDGFVVVARGPFVPDLRRMRPPTATFSAGPCISVSDGLCGRPAVPVVYR
jgi:hypothetical protein